MNKAKRVWVWCDGGGRRCEARGSQRVVCPECKQRFHPRVWDCHDTFSGKPADCWHGNIPPHKKKVKV